MGRLEGKVAIISGGAKGQGEAEAKLFVSEGAKVVFGDILDEEGKKVESEIVELGGDATYLHLDVTVESDWESVVQVAEDQYGHLDILVNNAGISLRHDGLDLTGEEWDKTMEVNAKGVFLGTKYSIPAMQRSGGGSIINVSSRHRYDSRSNQLCPAGKQSRGNPSRSPRPARRCGLRGTVPGF